MNGLLGIGLAFLILGILIYLKVDFGYGILIATTVLLLFSNPSVEGLNWVYGIATSFDTISLVIIIVLIGYLGFFYKHSGQVFRMIKELRGVVPDRRIVIASIPALFGLMPMPGGALVSAPMIDDEGDRLDISSVFKTFINWWFRHIWFAVYPLSLGLIFASRISGLNLYLIALFNLPIFIVQVLLGAYYGLNRIENKESKKLDVNPSILIWETMPIIIALSLNLIPTILNAFPSFLNTFGIQRVPVVPFYISLILAVIFIIFQNRDKYGLGKIPKLAKEGFSTNLLMASFGIMLFKGIIDKTDAIGPAVASLQNYLPLIIVIVLVAVAIGLMFGHLPGAIGIGFPVLIPLLPVVNIQTVGLIYLLIFMGYLVSPIHLCIILTIEYFGTTLKSFYKKIAVPFVILVISVLIWLIVSGALFEI